MSQEKYGMESRSQLLSVHDLSVSFAGKPVVQGVSFELAAGEKLALVGSPARASRSRRCRCCAWWAMRNWVAGPCWTGAICWGFRSARCRAYAAAISP
jgi:hypothetical protein